MRTCAFFVVVVGMVQRPPFLIGCACSLSHPVRVAYKSNKGGSDMAYSVNCAIGPVEVRSVERGVSKKGNEYRSLKLDDGSAYILDVSCTDSSLFSDLDSLGKGDLVMLKARCVATKDRSFISLVAAPVVTGSAYDER